MKHSVTSYNTKRHLVKALADILKEKDLNKISVSEVAERAGVNRKTFYYHFKDIQSMLYWIADDQIEIITNKYDMSTDTKTATEEIMNYLDNHRDLIQNIVKSAGSEHLQKFLYAFLWKFVHMLADESLKQQEEKPDDDYVQFVCEFYTAGLSCVLIDYVMAPEVRSREKLSKYLQRIYKTIALN